MAANCDLATTTINSLRLNPVHSVLFDLGQAAVQYNTHTNEHFQRLIAYLIELADGRDRREPWTNRPGVARPVPKLRVALDQAFGMYGDLQWFKLNKTTNRSGQPLVGLFPRMAASLSRIDPAEFGGLVKALVSSNPDAALVRALHRSEGKVSAAGVQLFSRLAFAFRRDLYFVIPGQWGERSGVLKYIDNDLRRYVAVCKRLREVCDGVGISSDIRGSVFHHLIEQDKTPATLANELGKAIGPTLARYAVLEPGEAYEADAATDDKAANPLEFSAETIRARRGDRKLRNSLRRIYGDQCAVTGSCPADLLEVAYIVPFPSGNVHSLGNAILLRSDLHTLWDLNQIGVHPETLQVQIGPRLVDSKYAKLHGRKLVERTDGSKVSVHALKERWSAFNADMKSQKAKTGSRKTASTSSQRAEEPIAVIDTSAVSRETVTS